MGLVACGRVFHFLALPLFLVCGEAIFDLSYILRADPLLESAHCDRFLEFAWSLALMLPFAAGLPLPGQPGRTFGVLRSGLMLHLIFNAHHFAQPVHHIDGIFGNVTQSSQHPLFDRILNRAFGIPANQ